jgi:phage recombination protein Bet
MGVENNLVETKNDKPFFNEEQKKALMQESVFMKGATDAEFYLFGHICKRTGLDPFARQIYSIKRGNRRTIQTGIDGFRLIAERSGNYAGSSKITFTDENGDNFKEIKGQIPAKAEITIQKIVKGQMCYFTGEARWSEYFPGNNPIWKKMPCTMLGKCAEALALRKAFPADLSGLYTKEEMEQADEEPAINVDKNDIIVNQPNKNALEKVKDTFPKALIEHDSKINETFIKLIKAYGFKLDEEGVDSPIEGILRFCDISTDNPKAGKDLLLTLPIERKKVLIQSFKKVL